MRAHETRERRVWDMTVRDIERRMRGLAVIVVVANGVRMVRRIVIGVVIRVRRVGIRRRCREVAVPMSMR